jgi:HEAT repeat protein
MIAIVLAAIAGCGGEDRGPLLAGGREVKSWVADLHDPKPQVRRQAVLKLGNVGDDDPTVTDALAEALHDTDLQVRRAAILAVVKLKQPGLAIKNQLDTMSKSDKDSRARDLAGKALDRLGKSE